MRNHVWPLSHSCGGFAALLTSQSAGICLCWMLVLEPAVLLSSPTPNQFLDLGACMVVLLRCLLIKAQPGGNSAAPGGI